MIYIPNLLTLVRIGLVPWLVVLLSEHQYMWSLIVFLVAGLSDALDGFIAKHFNAQTKLGALLDPVADKALLVSSYVMLSSLDAIPFWLMVVVVFRDVIIVGGYLIMEIFFDSVEMQPLKISKINTVTQIGYIAVILTMLTWSIEMSALLPMLEIFVLLTSVYSGAAYVYIWSIKATKGYETL